MNRLILFIFGLLYSLVSLAQTNGDWTELGPKDFPPHINWQLSGVARISQMKFHPTDPNTLYAVNAMGGLFISRDKGANWSKTGADNLPQTRCASVCIDNSNDQVIYLGTGDPSYYSNGYGIWKSTNGGYTWAQYNNGIGNRMAVEILMPGNSGSLIAATNDGIWKSTDGGANWVVKKAGGQFTDMVFQANSNDVMFACTMNEFWRSTNKGETWTRITLPGNGISGGGRVAVSKNNPNVVYLTYVGNFGSGVSTPVLKSTDGGLTFTVVKAANSFNLNGYDENGGGQGNYNYSMSANPNDANHLMIVGHIIWKSTNGGSTWNKVSTDWAHQVHTDMRQVPFSPYVANELYNINDGGIWRSWDNGSSWLPICNGLVGTESYIGCQSPVRKDAVSIGAQDNGEFYYSGGIWYINGAGDYHSNIISDNISANYYYDLSGTGRRRGLPQGPDNSLNLPFNAGNGQNVFSSFPLSSTQTAFLGYKEVYRSTNISNNPPTWTQITSINRQVKAVASSPVDANILYVITDDGKLRRSDNALSGTPTFTTYNTPSATNVTASIAVMKSNPDIVYMVCNNKAYRSTNKGANWTDITANLPSVNYHKILHDVNSTNEAVYIAGYNSVFYKDNTMANWVNFSKGLPSVVNFHRFYMYNDGTDNSVLRFISAGRGVWETGLYGRKPVLRTPENPENAISGIVYNAYEGTWSYLPNFNSLTPVKTGPTDIPSLAVGTRTDNIALTFDGYIDVPADGKYTFYTTSDDGTQFFIGNEMVINNDGIHGDQERSGYMWLKKGKHKFTLTYFQGVGGRSLSFSWAGPGITKQLVPASALYRLSPMSTCPENGSISVEKWTGIGGTGVAAIPVGNTPAQTYTNPNFESKTDDGDNYGVRYRGYICPPYTGNYTFYVASDDGSELWLSTSGDPAGKTRIAYLNGSVNQRNWYTNASQKSAKVFLKAGQKYYVEALHKEGGGGDHFAAAWILPSGEFQAPIPGKHLSPFKNNTFPTVSITTPANNSAYIAGTAITVNATATDAGGSVTKVEFYVDDIKVSEDNTSPYNFAWNPPQGVYSLTARAIDNLGAVSVSAAVAVTVVDLRTPENPALTKSNLDYKYYEYTGDWSVLPNYASLTPVKTETNPTFTNAIKNRDDHYGIVYTGFIDVPQDGIYTFYTNSDDGSKLYFGNQLLINNDGIHGMVEKGSIIGLKKGKHAISLEFFQNAGGQGLQVSYSGPGIAKREIPASVLYRQIFSNNSPVVTLNANKQTALAPASFTLTTTATDNDGTITKIELYSGTTMLSQSAASPLTYNYNNLAVGTYTITAKAYDDNNAVTTSSVVTLTVTANQAPTVSITAPANNSTYVAPASFAITANAADADGTISKVEFYNGATLLTTVTASPYTYNWANVGAGTYTVTAKAYDDLGLAKTSAAITIQVNGNQNPVVSITSPANNASFTTPVNITLNATASDADGTVSKVEFYNGTNLLGTDNASPFTYTWNNVTAGTYTITAKATDDKNGVTTSSAITIVVSNPNQAPTVSISAPANNATYVAAASIAINAIAADTDGNISKVEFYNGTTLLGTSTTNPYSYTWSNVAIGTYSITAKAYDNFGLSTTSTAITVKVNANQSPVVTMTANSDSPNTVSIAVNATDGDGSIVKVEYFDGTTKIGESTLQPYTFTWTNAPAGSHSITAVVTDDKGGKTTSNAVVVQVVNPNQLPTVTITAPADNSTFISPASFTIKANAYDIDGSIVKVEFYNGTVKIGEDATSPYSLDIANVANGVYTITVKAYDNKSAVSTSSPVTITVIENQVPYVFISNPQSGNTYTEPASIAIEANASDVDGTVQRVEFYYGLTKIGEDNTAPYSFQWDNAMKGLYTITAKAFDDKNASFVSQGLDIEVKSVATSTEDSIFNQQTFSVYPNPVYTETTIQFSVNSKASVQFMVYDTKGNLVKEILKSDYETGTHQIKLDLSNFSDGVYLLKTVANNKIYSTRLFKGSKPKNSKKELSQK